MENMSGVINGVTCDSRRVRPGYIFFALRGCLADGNFFAADAAARGAAAIVTDRPAGLPELGVPVIAVPNARQALAECAAHFYRHPSRSLALTGVTGTNGKTTVAAMIEHIFRLAGRRTGLIGTVGVSIGAASFPSVLTTPDAVSLQEYLAAMRLDGVSHAVMEVSAQGIEMHRTHALHFACGIITNISPDHLDFHGGFAAYLEAKRRFPALLGEETPLVVNSADPLCRDMAAAGRSRTITCAVSQPADICAAIRSLTSFGSKFTLSFAPNAGLGLADPVTVRLPLPGRHNIENAALAVAATVLQGVAPATAAAALASFSPVARRMEIFHLAGITVVDDTALNPGSLEAVLAAVEGFRFRRLTVVNAIRGGRGGAINSVNAATLAARQAANPFTLIVTASTHSVAPADTVTAAEKTAFLAALDRAGSHYRYTETLPAAIALAAQNAAPGDLVLLLGAQGMDEGYQLLRSLLADSPPDAPLLPEIAISAD